MDIVARELKRVVQLFLYRYIQNSGVQEQDSHYDILLSFGEGTPTKRILSTLIFLIYLHTFNVNENSFEKSWREVVCQSAVIKELCKAQIVVHFL